MALFKISKGSKSNLPDTLTEGFCWYTYDDSKFYIDHKDEKGVLVRKALNAQDAETLTGASLATILNSSDIEIPTSKAVKAYVDNAVANASGNVELDITLSETGKAADAKAVGDALAGKANTSDIPTNVSQLTNDKNYLTSVPSEYVTETELNAKGYLTQHQSLSGYAKTADHYTKTESDNKYQAKGNYLTSVPSEYVTETELSAKGYLTSAPVTKVNNKTGAVTLSASDVGADASGTASSAVSSHNTNTSAHSDIRTAINGKADKSEGAFFVVGSGTTDSTAKTSTWTGTSDRITEYYDGLTIRYKIGVAGQTTTTLNINGLGAKPIYLYNTTKLTTQFPVNSIINLIYHADLNDGSWMCSDYDSNTNTYQRVYPTTTNTEYPITTRYNTTTGSSYYAEYGRYSTGVTLNPSTNTITATKFKGALTGNADTATKATQDASGNVITTTYETKADANTKMNEINSQISQLSSEKVDKTNIVQTTGDSTTAVMSQKATTDALAQMTQTAPEFVDSIEQCTDTSKLYVLPDGYIYAWMLTEKEVESGSAYTNKLPLATDTDRTTIYGDDYNGDGKNDGYLKDTRLSSSGSTAERVGAYASGFIPASVGDTLRIKGTKALSGLSQYVISYNGTTKVNHKEILYNASSLEWSQNNTWCTYADGILTIPLTSANFGSGFDAIRFSCGLIDENTIVTVNEEITEGGGNTTTVTEYAWLNTGHAFIPADYEDRIIDMEYQVEQNTNDIEKLKKGSVDTGNLTALEWIRQWDAPIYDRVPVWEIKDEKAAISTAEKTVASVYAKYDALMAEHPDFITRTDLGLCSDGVTHVYRYDFREKESRHQSGFEWSETKPKFIVVTGIHREWNGIYGMYNALAEIATNPELAELRRSVHFIVIPVLNPYSISGAYSTVGHAANYNGVEIHRNFEVGFTVQNEGTFQYSGETPLSEIESQYLDNILKNNTDAAYFLTCHSFDRDKTWGVGFLWGSSATKYMCNMACRVIDKMGKAWHKRYGETWEQGIKAANDAVVNDLTKYPNATALEDGDYRIGHAALTNTGGCEQRQATKYGIQATNFEVGETFFVLDGTSLSAKAITHGAEAYVNFFLTAMDCYDHKDKKQYFVI